MFGKKNYDNNYETEYESPIDKEGLTYNTYSDEQDDERSFKRKKTKDFSAYLNDGERVLWHASAKSFPFLKKIIILMSILFIVPSTINLILAISLNDINIYELFSALFSILLTAGIFIFILSVIEQKITYILTESRFIKISKKKCNAYELNTLTSVSMMGNNEILCSFKGKVDKDISINQVGVLTAVYEMIRTTAQNCGAVVNRDPFNASAEAVPSFVSDLSKYESSVGNTSTNVMASVENDCVKPQNEEKYTYSSADYIDDSDWCNRLDGDENLLWTGKTITGGDFKSHGYNLKALISSIPILFFAFIWTTIGLNVKSTTYIGIFIIFLILKPILRPFLNRKSCYAITDKRLMILSHNKVTSCLLENVSDLSVYKGKNDIGYVMFSFINEPIIKSKNSFSRKRGFFCIKDPNEAYRILNDAIYITLRKNNSYMS